MIVFGFTPSELIGLYFMYSGVVLNIIFGIAIYLYLYGKAEEHYLKKRHDEHEDTSIG